MLDSWAGRPSLAWRLRELVRFGVSEILILSPGATPRAEATLRAIAAASPRPVTLALADRTLGEAAGLLHERFLLCERAALFDGNVAALLAASAGDPAGAPGRVLETTWGEDTGIAARTRAFDVPVDRLPRSRAAGRLIDPHTPMAPPEPRPALFFDRDGTLNVDHGYVGTRERFEWIRGAREAMARATDAGWHVFIVTNQSGVARGFYDATSVERLHEWLADEVRAGSGTVDDVRFCPFHPEAADPRYRRASGWRKPAPGMLLDLIAAWELNRATCLLVGDQPGDLAAAAACGVAGHRFSGGDLDDFVRPLLAPTPVAAV